jgi:hypothetical protein
MTLPDITEVQRLTLKPGDRLIVRVEGVVSADQAGEMAHIVRDLLQLPADTPVLVTGGDISVEVIGG